MVEDIFLKSSQLCFFCCLLLSKCLEGGLTTTGENQYLIPRSSVETCALNLFFGCPLAETSWNRPQSLQLAGPYAVSS